MYFLSIIIGFIFTQVALAQENKSFFLTPTQNSVNISTSVKKITVLFKHPQDIKKISVNGDCGSEPCFKRVNWKSTRKMEILFPNGLKRDFTYTIWISLKDTNRTNLITKWVFSTKKEISNITTTFSPKNQSSNVETNINFVKVFFSEKMNTRRKRFIFGNCVDNNCAKYSYWEKDKQTLVINFPNGLKKEHKYILRLGIPPYRLFRAVSGEYMQPTKWSFSTGDNLQKPRIKSFLPKQGSVSKLGNYQKAQIKFIQPMNTKKLIITGNCPNTPCYKIMKWVNLKTLEFPLTQRGKYNIGIGNKKNGGLASSNGEELSPTTWEFEVY